MYKATARVQTADPVPLTGAEPDEHDTREGSTFGGGPADPTPCCRMSGFNMDFLSAGVNPP